MWKLATLMLILTTASGAWSQDSKTGAQPFAWREFKAAFAEAETSKKMVFVDIYTQW